MADADLFGAPAEWRESITKEKKQFQVWAENVEALGLFLDLQTQWNNGPVGVTGLNYASVEAVFSIRGVVDRARKGELFDCLLAMEAAALKVFRSSKG